tara:strand:- start:1345 stop:2199 length:855 start_codon:yes stop_codon:yes gene_type:complete
MKNPIKLASLLVFTMVFFAACSSASKMTTLTTSIPHESFLFIIKKITFSICPADISIEEKKQSVEEQCAKVGEASISGSGFVVASDGTDSWGITAGHVCADDQMMLRAPDGSLIEPKIENSVRVMILGGEAYRADVEAIYPSLDLCVLHIKGMLSDRLVEMSDEPPIRGERSYVMSAPLGTFGPDLLPIFEGFYNGRTMNYPPPMGGEKLPYSVFTIPTKGGSSGSPILNSKGKLVGVTSGTLVGFENIAFSPPYEGVKEVVDKVKTQAFESYWKRQTHLDSGR